MMHSYWDPKDHFDFNEVSEAAAFIGEGLQKWGRMDIRQYKEKFGEVRVYCSLGIHMWHQLIWPGYCANQYRWKWMWVCDIYFPKWVFRVVNWFAIPYHTWLYKRFYRLAAERWPHIRAEIYEASDYPELLGAKLVKHFDKEGNFPWHSMEWPWNHKKSED